MIRWEHMAKVVESLKYQIQEESECRLNAVSKTLEQLTMKKKLTVKQKERHLTELFKDFWEEVSRYNKGACFGQSEDDSNYGAMSPAARSVVFSCSCFVSDYVFVSFFFFLYLFNH